MILIGAVLLAAVIHYQEPVGKFLSLSRTIHFLPFFLMGGYYIKKEQFQAVINNAKCRKALPAVLLLSACVLIPYGRGVQKSSGVFFFGIAPLCTAEKSAVSLCTAHHLYPVDGGGCADALWSVYPLPEKGNLPLPIRGKIPSVFISCTACLRISLIYGGFMSCSVQMAILPFWRLWLFPFC